MKLIANCGYSTGSGVESASETTCVNTATMCQYPTWVKETLIIIIGHDLRRSHG